MARRSRRSGSPRPRGVSGQVAATLARRREARAERVVLRDAAGVPRTLDAELDPDAQALLAAAEELISAAQRGSRV